MSSAPPILWCSVEDPRLNAVGGLPILGATPDTLSTGSALAVVLDTRSFASHDAALAFRARVSAPVLWLLEAEEAEAYLPHLPEHDDCTLALAPAALIAHRLRRLLEIGQAYDGLTGLLDRTSFQNLAQQHLTHSPASLLFLDLDHFKHINDTHGHLTGDAVLRELGGLMARHCAPALVSRFGGEELAVLLSTDEPGLALERAELLRTTIEAASWPEDVGVTVSIGVSGGPTGTSLGDLVSRADAALYAAKAAGRNTSMHYRELERKATDMGGTVELLELEHLTQVLTERFSGRLTRRSARLIEAARNQAQTDGVTGLPTRRSFDRHFTIAFDHAYREAEPLCVGLIDIDHFGAFNKDHGWPTGDKVLTQVASTLSAHLPERAWLARYGGDELVLVLPRLTLDEAHALAQRLRDVVAQTPFNSTRGQTLTVSISIGLAEFHREDPSHATLLERASDQLLAAKRDGRNRVR